MAALLSLPACAEETAAFLKIGVGARALGLGGAYTALSDEASGLAWNPAGAAGLTKRELGVTHAELFAGTRYDFIGFVQPSKFGSFGASAIHLSQAALQGRDEAGRTTGSFGASDSAVALSYAAWAPLELKVGGSLKFVQSAIGAVSAQTAALDLGAQRTLGRLGPGMPALGVAVQNLGPGMKYAGETSPLPLVVAVGAAYKLPMGLTFAADYKQRPNLRTSEFCLGTEYALLSGFALRGGYGTARALSNGSSGTAALGGMAAGLGFKAKNGYSLDYSITPFGELGSVQRFSLGARF